MGRRAITCKSLPAIALFVLCGVIGCVTNKLCAEPIKNLDRQLDRAANLAESGDIHAADRIYRNILQQQPQHDVAYQSLITLASSRSLSVDSPAASSARSRLPQNFAVHQTDRFVLFTDMAESLATRNAQWIERAHDEFSRFVRECGLRPLPLQHKLVCIVFEQREEYVSFAKSQDGLMNVNFTGYYSPRHDRMVFSMQPDRTADLSSDDARTRRPSSDGKSVLGFSSRGIDGDTNAASEHDQCDHERQIELLCDSAAKCVHETIHQLMFHTRLMSPDLQYPLWICEGLSTAFETDSPQLPFGPDHEFAPRRKAFQSLLANDALLPLQELVTITQLSSSKPQVTRAVYQQSYALVTWLCRERKPQLREYLQIMREQSAGKLSASRHLALFERAFGDVDSLEAAWLDHERNPSR